MTTQARPDGREAEVLLDGGQRHVHDRLVEDDHQHPRAEDDEGQPAGVAGGMHGSRLLVRGHRRTVADDLLVDDLVRNYAARGRRTGVDAGRRMRQTHADQRVESASTKTSRSSSGSELEHLGVDPLDDRVALLGHRRARLGHGDDARAAVGGGGAALGEAGLLELVDGDDHRRLVERAALGEPDLRLVALERVGRGRSARAA